jgi:hypothetical protein
VRCGAEWHHSSAKFLQRSSFFFAAFELDHHAFNVSVILVPPKELQAFLRIAPLQDFDRLLTRAPGIHLALVRHVEIDRVVTGKRRPAVIFYAVTLSGGKQAENRASLPPRPISRGNTDAFVGPGVTVDEGAILEAGAIVLKDVKPWMIVIENTARD